MKFLSVLLQATASFWKEVLAAMNYIPFYSIRCLLFDFFRASRFSSFFLRNIAKIWLARSKIIKKKEVAVKLSISKNMRRWLQHLLKHEAVKHNNQEKRGRCQTVNLLKNEAVAASLQREGTPFLAQHCNSCSKQTLILILILILIL